jgi:hypothetical protein
VGATAAASAVGAPAADEVFSVVLEAQPASTPAINTNISALALRGRRVFRFEWVIVSSLQGLRER